MRPGRLSHVVTEGVGEGSHSMLCLRMSICLHVEAGTLHSALAFLSLLLLCSKSSGSAALLALTWTCLLVRIVFPLKAKRQGDIWNKLVGPLSLEPWGSAFPRVFGMPCIRVLS